MQSDQHFYVHCLNSIIPLVSIFEIAVAAQAGLSLIWSQTPEDRFSRVVAHMISIVRGSVYEGCPSKWCTFFYNSRSSDRNNMKFVRPLHISQISCPNLNKIAFLMQKL